MTILKRILMFLAVAALSASVMAAERVAGPSKPPAKPARKSAAAPAEKPVATPSKKPVPALIGPAAPAAAPRLDKWIVIGPGGGGGQFRPTVSPLDPNKVFVRCDMTGAYVTEDGGNSWRMFNRMSVVEFFVWDPVDPNVAYCKSLALWRTEDGCKTWNLVHPDPDNVKRLVVSGDHGEESIATKDGAKETITALAVDPANSKTLFAGMTSGGESMFATSKDWGKTWRKERFPYRIRKVYVDPGGLKNERTVYTIGDNSVSVRDGGEWTHHKPPRGVRYFTDATLGFPGKNAKAVVYATTQASWAGDALTGGIMVSEDGGATWRGGAGGLGRKIVRGETPRFGAIAACLSDPQVAYVGYDNMRLGRGENESYQGAARTSDGGRTWDPAVRESQKPSPNETDIWLSELFGMWAGSPIDLGVCPTNPDVCYGTDDGRTMRTTDGLKTWVSAYSKRWPEGATPPDCTYTTTGLDVTTCYGVHFDPFDENRIFISYTDIGLFYSEDRGTSWTNANVPGDWRNTTYWMVFDPEVKGRAWAVMSSTHDLPRPKMWRRGDPSRYRGGAAVSEDGGRTWAKSNSGMTETGATHMLLDPKSPRDARVLYAAGFGTGIWKSADGGKSWKLMNNGIDLSVPKAWRLAMDPKGVLYAIIARGSDDGSYGNALDGKLYRSTDGAATWQEVPLPEGVNGPNGLAIDPDDPNRMYLAAWGREQPDGAIDGGIYLTTDGGKTWKDVFSKGQYVYDVTIDPRDPKLLYACGFENSVWRSADRGETWTRIKGFNFKWGHRVICDPKNADRIFVTTFGGSVWYGPATGDPDAKEDIVTPLLSYEALYR